MVYGRIHLRLFSWLSASTKYPPADLTTRPTVVIAMRRSQRVVVQTGQDARSSGNGFRCSLVREGCGVIEESWLGVAFDMAIELDGVECKGVVTLGELKYDALHGGRSGAMLDR
jgi:hypothetical protein